MPGGGRHPSRLAFERETESPVSIWRYRGLPHQRLPRAASSLQSDPCRTRLIVEAMKFPNPILRIGREPRASAWSARAPLSSRGPQRSFRYTHTVTTGSESRSPAFTKTRCSPPSRHH